jgi:transglutaminase-like putative cysteine protease
MNPALDHYTSPSYFIDSENKDISSWTEEITQGIEPIHEQAIALYYAVRDGWRYNPYRISLLPEHSKASSILDRDIKEGHCIDKAILLCALGRAAGIPSRLHFANVKNHIGTEKLEEYLGTNVLVFHGFLEFHLNGEWVKCTPAFNDQLCQKLNVVPLEFDGKNDSIFQEYDKEGGQFMEYLHDYGIFHEFPLDMFEMEIRKYYPKVFEHLG